MCSNLAHAFTPPLEDLPLPPDPIYADQAAFAAEVALQQACGGFKSPSPESECLDEFDLTLRPSRVEQLEWELWSEYHHLIKDNPHWGWSVTNHPDGRTTYVAPTGHRYETVPPDRGPVDPPPSPEDPPPF